MSGNNIRVLCRFRPQNKREIAEGGTPVVKYSEDYTTVKVESKEYPGEFTFDRIFDQTTSQRQFFEQSIQSTVDDVIGGYNGTIFAYGQTGSGKTFTMMGAGIDDDSTKGIIPRIVETVFTSIFASTENIEYTVKVSYMEIYLEKIRDLLNPVHDNLPVHEDKNNGVYVKGLTEVYVSSVNEVYQVLETGSQARMVAYTNMNAESSRSHSIFVINVEQKNLKDGSQKRGRLFLVDLAGSEKVGKTGATGQTLEEAKKINKSLSALGMVINALTDGKSKHIPYRDSKLTRILQESLGGNSRTTLIINCSPSSFNDAETVSTLRFGMRAKSIKNKAKVNAELSPAELKAMLKKAKTQILTFRQFITVLEGEVKIWRSGGIVPEDQWANMEKASKGEGLPPAETKTNSPPAPTSSPPLDTLQVPVNKGIPDRLLDSVSRASTPFTLVEDEREEFMKRENELNDLLTQKESQLTNVNRVNESLETEVKLIREDYGIISEENKTMTAELSTLKVEFDKVTFANRDHLLQIENITESNTTMSDDLKKLKDQLETILVEKDIVEKEKEKMAKTIERLSKIDPAMQLDNWATKEKEMREAMATLDNIDGLPTMTAEEVTALRQELAEKVAQIEKDAVIIVNIHRENNLILKKRDEIESRLSALEMEYEELLEKSIADEEASYGQDSVQIQDLKSKIEAQYNAKKEMHMQEIVALKDELQFKLEENQNMSASLIELKTVNEELKRAVARAETAKPRSEGADKESIENIRKSMAKQLLDFDVMKRSLMRDLQNKCEKVIELEITLENTRDQLNAALRSNNSKAQQQKLIFLERNLEQLTNVQKQLVEQNTTLKKDVHLAERKLLARNERISSLETLLKDNQDKLAAQNQKFEKQVAILRERLDSALVAKKQQDNTGFQPFNFGRIAKPLRGQAPAPEDPNKSLDPDGSFTLFSRPERSGSVNKRTSWLWRS